MIFRKASQTSVYLQEWDIPFEQIELEELIGQGRWGKVYKGKWHGEVAIRMLEIDGNNQDHLKLFKKEVMNYRQTRHENVVLFMGACMHPPHLAIITRWVPFITLYWTMYYFLANKHFWIYLILYSFYLVYIYMFKIFHNFMEEKKRMNLIANIM